MKNSKLTTEETPHAMCLKFHDRRFRLRAFRLFLCLEIIFLVLPYFVLAEYFEAFFDVSGFWLFIIFLLLVVLPFCVFMRSNVHSHVVFLENYMEIPRWFFLTRRVSTESIVSLEEMKFGDRDFGVLVGLRNGEIINYEESTFEEGESYKIFKRCIENILGNNAESKNVDLVNIAPLSWGQNILLLLLSSLFIVVYLQLANIGGVDFYEALEVGALTKIVLSGENFYRIAASFFLHLNSFHISMNILSLALFGQFLLRVVDLYRFICILLLSAFLASLLTLALSPYEAIIGASGGIMGVFGAYCCLRLLRYLPGSISSSSNAWILFFIAVQVALEYFVEGIDSYTHAGGFVTGFVYMWFCIRYEKDHSVFESSVYEKVAACGLALCYLGGLLLFFSKLYAAV